MPTAEQLQKKLNLPDEQLELIRLLRDQLVTELDFNKLIEELKASEYRHRRLIEHLGSEYFMFVQEITTRHSYVSPTVEECLGYTPEDFIENYWNYLTSNKINENINLAFKQALSGEKPEPFEVEIFNSRQQKCCLRISETPVFDSAHRVIAVEGLVHNITQQKQLEETARQSLKMEAVGQLSGGIAHDFNNQLGIVMGYLDMLSADESLSANQLKWVDAAVAASQRCTELTQSLMSFSRKKILSQSVISLNECLMSMRMLLERALTTVAGLEFKLDSEVVNVVADAGELQDAILNLVLNARDAMGSTGTVVITTENVVLDTPQQFRVNKLPGGRYVRLGVEDDGRGMDSETLQRMFEPFFTTKSTGQGTGLGMAMVFGFASRVNGAIDVESKQGEGTKIELYLPQVRQSTVAVKEVAAEQPLPQGSEHILLVEDEPALRDLAEEYLTGLGYQVYVAGNAAQALDIINLGMELDLLFSDVVMPGSMDGFELADEAKKLRPGIKVLMATGYASERQAEKYNINKKDEILYKPYSRSILAQRLRRVLDKEIDENITG